MLLIGTMDWASTRLKGTFACPNCDSSESFRLRASRPFLTLYFIPILPIGGLQEYVQCSRCKTSFEPDILATRLTGAGNSAASMAVRPAANGTQPSPTSQIMPSPPLSFEQDLLRAIALMMVDDGQVTEEEIRIARRLYENITEENLSRENLGRMCAHVQQQRLSTLSFLATASQRRNHSEKLLLVQAMFGVAGADGKISPGRLNTLVETQKVLGLDENEFQRAIASTDQWLT